jgi:hypothetical protein
MKYFRAIAGKISFAILAFPAVWLLLRQYSAPVGIALCPALFFAFQEDRCQDDLRPGARRPHRKFDKALTSWVNAEVIEHLVRAVMDGLNVCRPRQIRRGLQSEG